MTFFRRDHRPASLLRRWRAACEVMLCVGVGLGAFGCKSSRTGSGGLFRDGKGVGLARGGDPLLGGARIPPQNLPVPGAGEAYGSRAGTDPLFGLPGSSEPERGTATRRTKEKNTKASQGETASRAGWERGEPWRPTRDVSNAALAGGLPPDDDGLSFGDRRPAVVPAALPTNTNTSPTSLPTSSGPVPLRPRTGSITPSSTTVSVPTTQAEPNADLRELDRLGIKWQPPVREGNLFVIRADVPVSAESTGLVRRYEGAGPTPADAVKQLLDQVRSAR